jgi:hypothetical protein
MSDFHQQVKGQLTESAAMLFPPTTRPVQRERRARRMPLLAAVVAGALLFAAAAFAASQIIGAGAPVTASSSQERPTKTTGVGAPVAGSRRAALSAQLLPISVADPAGGLPWGIRLVRTTRGLLCVQVGRLLNGRLGVLGQDGEFHNDGLFHELPAAVLDPYTCSQPQDSALYRSEGLAAAGAMPGPARSCLYPGASPEDGSRLPACPAADERILAFGLLGPDALSVSYPAAHGVQTQRTTGSDGAYLLVLRQPPVDPRTLAAQAGPVLRRFTPAMLLNSFPTLGSTSSPMGHFPLETGSAVILAAQFRFGKHKCQSGSAIQPGGGSPCTSRIARIPNIVPFIQPGLHTSVHVTSRLASGGYELELTFRAPASVFDASTAYGVQLTMPQGSSCRRSGVSGQSSERDIHRGELIHIPLFIGRPTGCAGLVRGRVIYGRQPDGFTGPVGGETIGRFAFNLR